MSLSTSDIHIVHAEAVPVDIDDRRHQYATATVTHSGRINLSAAASASTITVSPYNEGGAREILASVKWPVGLQDAFIQNLSRIPIRFFICDDSGSMVKSDGHRLLSGANGLTKSVQCTRWQELTEGLKFHAKLAHAASAPTEFRLLNNGMPVRVGIPSDSPENNQQLLEGALHLFDSAPSGQTPLCKHIREVIAQIQPMAAQLRASNQKACVIIATDGESTDGDIITAMQPLRNLPVWVVVRLCTDEDRVVEYWNNIDSQLEMDMDVLDDLSGEAQEVYANNSWLTYGEPLHRLREFGVLIKEMDLMDSDKLSLDQVHKICCIIFGGSLDSYPHPELDFKEFLAVIDKKNRLASKVWDPVSKKPQEWVVRSRLARLGPGASGCVVS